MSDPLERLRRDAAGSSPPPMDAIRARAARIERRRHYVLGGGGGVIAVIALVALFAGTTPNDTERRLAQSGVAVSPTPEFIAGTASPPTENSAEHRLAEPDTGSTLGTGGTTAATVTAPQQESDSRTTGGAAMAGEAAAPDIEVSLEVSDQSFGFFRQIEFTLNACNNGTEAVERTFPTGQRYDFEVGRDGQRVWRWSDDQVFTQEFGNERWEPGECKTYSESWDGQDSNGSSVPGGEYRAFGVLSSDPPLRTGTQAFCVDSC